MSSSLKNRVEFLEGKISVQTARGERTFIITHSINDHICIDYTGTTSQNGKYFFEDIPNAKRLNQEAFSVYRDLYFNDTDNQIIIRPASKMKKVSQ